MIINSIFVHHSTNIKCLLYAKHYSKHKAINSKVNLPTLLPNFPNFLLSPPILNGRILEHFLRNKLGDFMYLLTHQCFSFASRRSLISLSCHIKTLLILTPQLSFTTSVLVPQIATYLILFSCLIPFHMLFPLSVSPFPLSFHTQLNSYPSFNTQHRCYFPWELEALLEYLCQ